MKIVLTDNFNRELFDDKVIAKDVDKKHGELIVKLLNDRLNDNHPDFYVLMEDDDPIFELPWP